MAGILVSTTSITPSFLPPAPETRESGNQEKDQLADSVAAAGYDRERELKQFSETKAGIKGLVDAGIVNIPGFCHFPPSLRAIAPSKKNPSSIPIVDLSLPRPQAVELVAAAAREWGFFQVTNHGIPLDEISAAITAVQAFNELPTEVKAAYNTREETGGLIFNSNFTPSMRGAASWRDNIRVGMSPRPPNPEKIPEVCREELLQWDRTVRGLAARLMELLSEGMGVEAGRLEGLSCLEGRAVMGNYYPYCPQPELTLGLEGHTDPNALTVLVQNGVGGLLIKKENVFDDGEWVAVDPVPGAVVINVGDFLRMISNDEYKSVEHKVLANPHQTARISLAAFYFPGKADDSTYYGPLPELVSEEKPARYRRFAMSEIWRATSARAQGVSSVLHDFQVEDRTHIVSA